MAQTLTCLYIGIVQGQEFQTTFDVLIPNKFKVY